MSARHPPDDSPSVEEVKEEHRALKQQTAALRREHERLHALGGTKAQHDEHLQHLRTKIEELEEHCGKVKKVRKRRS